MTLIYVVIYASAGGYRVATDAGTLIASRHTEIAALVALAMQRNGVDATVSLPRDTTEVVDILASLFDRETAWYRLALIEDQVTGPDDLERWTTELGTRIGIAARQPSG